MMPGHSDSAQSLVAAYRAKKKARKKNPVKKPGLYIYCLEAGNI
jgi:hypothetical protein